MLHDGSAAADDVTGAVTPCPSDYEWSRKLQSCYKLVPKRVTWRTARESCLAEGADLVAIESDREQRHLNNAANQNPGTEQPTFAHTAFRGQMLLHVCKNLVFSDVM